MCVDIFVSWASNKPIDTKILDLDTPAVSAPLAPGLRGCLNRQLSVYTRQYSPVVALPLFVAEPQRTVQSCLTSTGIWRFILETS